MNNSVWTLTLICCFNFVIGCGGNGVTTGPPPPSCVNASSTVICTESGQVQGTTDGTIRAFRDIPYAAPPVGDLRWHPPQPPLKWQGIRDATKFGNVCPQDNFAGGVQGDEDCLNLNIYVADPPPASKQPVMVFFHGGANALGSNQGPPYDLPPPLATHGVVVVTAQYRLGLLGFLSIPELTTEGNGSSGTYGLMDMIQALTWVRDNISNFGGDPHQVMIFGQSSASAAVQVLLAAPPAQGLFARAGMHSLAIPSGLLAGGLQASYQNYAAFVPQAGCSGAADVLACLRAVPANAVVLIQLTPGLFQYIGYNIEPRVIPVDPFDKLKREGSPVPLLIGSTREEATALGDDPTVPLDAAGYAAAVHAEFDPIQANAANQVLSLYPSTSYDTPKYALVDVDSDHIVSCNVRDFARAVSGAQRSKVWRYLFTHRYENNTFLNALRAFHGGDLPFVFGNLGKIYYNAIPYTPSADEVNLSGQMMDYWAGFAATGDPNGTGAVHWLPYDATTEPILQLDVAPSTFSTYHNPQCDFFATLPPYY